MSPDELIRFENYVRSCGYSANKERGRYCQGIVNLLQAAWLAAQEDQVGASQALHCAATRRGPLQGWPH